MKHRIYISIICCGLLALYYIPSTSQAGLTVTSEFPAVGIALQALQRKIPELFTNVTARAKVTLVERILADTHAGQKEGTLLCGDADPNTNKIRISIECPILDVLAHELGHIRLFSQNYYVDSFCANTYHEWYATQYQIKVAERFDYNDNYLLALYEESQEREQAMIEHECNFKEKLD